MKLIKSHYQSNFNKTKDSRPKNISTIASVKKFIDIKDKLLIYRKWGGMGDILNQRPLFKTIKDLYPNFHITYAIPKIFFELVEDHPYIDKIIDCQEVNLNDYGYVVDISSDCGRYENSKMPYVDKHRSDIWAEISLGIKLHDHDYQFKLNSDLIDRMKNDLREKYKYNSIPKIAIFPRSASISKDLPDKTLFELIDLMKENNFFPCVIDSAKRIKNLEVPFIYNLSYKELIHLTSTFDYVISVDTGAFHLCAALEIPTVGIFPWTDGKILGKYHKKFVLLQRHREDDPKFSACPCWDWPVCPYKEKDSRFPLNCMKFVSAQDIYNKLLLLMERYSYESK